MSSKPEQKACQSGVGAKHHHRKCIKLLNGNNKDRVSIRLNLFQFQFHFMSKSGNDATENFN